MTVQKEKILVTVFTCERCGHRWLPRKPMDPIDLDDLPTVCASCKSRYWNTPYQRGEPPAAKKGRTKRAK